MPCSSSWDANGWILPRTRQLLGKLNEVLEIFELMLLFFQKVKNTVWQRECPQNYILSVPGRSWQKADWIMDETAALLHPAGQTEDL